MAVAAEGADVPDQQTDIRPEKTFVSIQYLRGFAALIVVYEHTFSNHIAADLTWARGFGLWGVDIFFVVSGFIMGCSISDSKPSWFIFLRNRTWRVLPLYWIATTAWISIRFLVHDRLDNRDVSLGSVIYSYLLIPSYHLVFVSHIWPVLVPGWTLQMELFFYGLLSLCLIGFEITVALRVVIVMLLVLASWGLLYQPENAVAKTYSSPLLLEFASGLMIARLRGALNHSCASQGCIVCGISVLAAYLGRQIRSESALGVSAMAIPAITLVVGALLCERYVAERRVQSFVLIGNASYSLYLFHPILTSLVAVLWVRVGLTAYASVFVVLALMTSCAGAIAIYIKVERPLMAVVRPRFQINVQRTQQPSPLAQ